MHTEKSGFVGRFVAINYILPRFYKSERVVIIFVQRQRITRDLKGQEISVDDHLRVKMEHSGEENRGEYGLCRPSS
jgi:hypothetical protein